MATRPRTPAWLSELAERQREPLDRVRPGARSCDEVEMPLIEVLSAMERVGVKLDTKRLAEIGEGMAERIAELEREIYELAGHEFTIGSPQQLGDGALRGARADQEAPRQDRLLDRRPRPRSDPRRARDRRQGRALARADEAQEHLSRLAAGPRSTPRRAASTPPSTRSPPRQGGSRAPTRTCRTSRSAPTIGRPVRGCFVAERGHALLSADYNQVELRVLAHVAGEDVLREIFASGEDVHAETAAEMIGADPDASRARRALEGEDGQLRDRLRALGLRPRRPAADLARGGGPLHRALLRALPGRQGVHRRDDRQGRARRVRRHAAGPPPRRSRSCARSSASAGRSGSGWRSTPSSRARRRTSSSSRWCDCHSRAGRGRPRDASGPADPRRAPLRGAGRRDGRGRGARARARCATPSSSTRRSPSTSASARTG